MTYHLVCTKSNTKGTTSGAGTAYPSESSEFTPAFLWGSCCSIFIFLCSIFYRLLFVQFILTIVLSVLPSNYNFWLPILYLLITPFVSSDYPFGIFWLPLWYFLITPLVSSDYPFVIFKLFLHQWWTKYYHQLQGHTSMCSVHHKLQWKIITVNSKLFWILLHAIFISEYNSFIQ